MTRVDSTTGSGIPPRRARGLRVILGVAGALVLVAAGFVTWALTTSAGAHWSLETAAARAPGKFSVARVEGSLLGPLLLEGAHWQADAGSLEVRRAILNVRWSALLAGHLDVTRLNLEGVRFEQGAGDTVRRAKTPESPGDVTLPIDLTIRNATLHDVEIVVGEGGPLTFREIRLDATSHESDVALRNLSMSSQVLDLALAGTITTRGRWPLDATLRWQARPDSLPAFAGEARVHGALDTLRVDHVLSAPVTARLDARIRDVLTRPRFDAELQVDRFQLNHLDRSWPDATVSLSARIRGTPDTIDARATAEASMRDVGRFGIAFEGVARGAVLDVTRLDVRSPDRPLVLSASGRVDATTTPSRVQADVAWRNLALAERDTTMPRSPRGRLRLEGDLSRYRLTLDADVDDRLGAAPSRWQAAAMGDSAGLVIDSLNAGFLGGSVHGRGTVKWSPDVRWAMRVHASDIDPALAWPEFPGRLGLSLASEGRMEQGARRAAHPRGKLVLERLTGSVRGRPVDGASRVAFASNGVTIEAAQLTWGGARLAASGHVFAPWAMEATIEIPRLGLVASDLGGSVRGALSVAGPEKTPTVRLRLDADSLRQGESRVESLALTADIDLAGERESTLELDARALDLPARVADALRLRGRGTPGSHVLDAAAEGPTDSATIRIEGAFEQTDWRGTLAAFEARSKPWGVWQLARPADAFVGKDRARLDQACIETGEGRACIDAQIESGVWRVGLALEQLPLERLGAYLPGDVSLRGPLDGRMAAGGGPGRTTTFDARLTPGPGEVSYPSAAGKSSVSRFDAGTISLRADERGVDGVAALAIPGLATLSATLSMPDYRPGAPLDPQRLEASVTASVPDLSPLSASAPGVGRVRGRLDVDLDVAGTVSAPEVRGQAALRDGAAELIEAGIMLEAIALQAEATGGDSLVLTGSARSGAGTLSLNGRIDVPRADSLRGQFRVTGRRVQALDRSDLSLVVDPDLEIAFAGTEVDVRGDVYVPLGSVNAAQAADRATVPLSPDVVVEDTTFATTAMQANIRTAVRVTLGDSLSLDAFGLIAKPRGRLLVREEPGRATTASGELTITGGTYRAYGQDLTIERGQLIFAGGPIENPALDIRASRTARDSVVAGIEVQGTALSPELTVFSIPPLPEEDALAYIVLGRPLAEAGAAEGSLVARAARSAGLQGGNYIAQKLAARVGIQEATIETDDGTLDDASLVLGTYLSPRVYVSYGFGLFKSANALRIRYAINSKWTVEAETAEENSAGIMYTIER